MTRILVADDSEENVELLRIILTRAGYEVAVAHDPEAAFASIAAQQPALAFLDLHMPGERDGLDLAQKVKDDPRTAGVILVALTGSVEDEGRIAAKAAGFDGFMTKPVDTRTFPDVVAGFLRDGAR